jgi:hypothetical protein
MKIKSLKFISSFNIDQEITLTCGKELKNLEKELKGKLVLPSVPDSAPPEAPRAILLFGDSILAIGWNRFELNVTPPQHVNSSYIGCLEFVKNTTIQVFRKLMELVNEYEWSGLITKCNFPFENNDPNNILPIFDKLVNMNRSGRSLPVFRLQFGYREDDFNKIYNLSRYDIRNIHIVVPPPQPGKGLIKIDTNKFPITESGLEINIDINNMTGAKDRIWDSDLTNLLEQHEKVYGNLPQELNLEGIIK